MMQLKPITASHRLVSPICSNTAAQVLTKPSASNFSPSKDFTWDVPIVKAAAVVNPAITGAAINSTRNPKGENLDNFSLNELSNYINYLN